CEEFCNETGASCVDNEYICQNCEYIFLAVKPQVMESVLSPLKSILKKRKDRFVLVTMAAGLSKKAVQGFAGGDYPIIRIMPNTPCSIGSGVI
ncbi:pyrroline-5-carboxylate reductase family protein, partial [Klebsiella pneumoniae]|uniref:pyrroline-5-carboxylate reductase family protein n=1 Tax=Klebsiella pneumoniae TaxID=573 RepID=UPI0025A08CC9